MTDLITRNGQRESVPDESVPQAIASGQYAFERGTRVPVYIDGELNSISAEDAMRFVGQPGIELASQEDFHKADIEAKYGGTLGEFIAGGIGGVRGLTLGLSDPIAIETARAFGGEESARRTREALAGYQEANPVASMVGDVAGSVLPTLVAPETTLARLGAAPRLAASAGRGVTKELGGKVIGHMVGAATEGAIYGVAHAVSESSLQDDYGHIGERLLADGGMGALLGGGLGAATGTVAGLAHGASRAVIGAVDSAREAGGALERAGATLGDRAVNAVDAASRSVSKVHEKVSGVLKEKLTGKSLKDMSEKIFGYVPEGFNEEYSKVASIISGGDRELIQRMGVGNLKDEAARLRNIAVVQAPKIREQAKQTIIKSLNIINNNLEKLSEEFFGNIKPEEIQRRIWPEVANQAKAANELVTDMYQHIDIMLTRKKVYGMQDELSQIRDNLLYVTGKIDKGRRLGGQEGATVIFDALNGMKQVYGKYLNASKMAHLIKDPTNQRLAMTTRSFFAESSVRIRQMLEDRVLWGAAGELQEKTNLAYHNLKNAQKLFGRNKVFKVVGFDGTEEKHAVNGEVIERYVKNLVNPDKDIIHNDFRNFITAADEFAKSIDGMNLTAEARAAADSIVGAAHYFKKSISEAEGALVMTNQLTSLRNAEAHSGFSLLAGALAGTLGGSMVGGLPGLALGLAAAGATTILTQPGLSMARLAALEQMIGRVDVRLKNISERILSAGPAVRRVGERVGAQASDVGARVSSAARDAGDRVGAGYVRARARVDALGDRVQASASRFAEQTERGAQKAQTIALRILNPQDIERDFYEKSDEIRSIHDSPAQFATKLNMANEELAVHAPETATSIASLSSVAIRSLYETMPQVEPSGQPGVPDRVPTPIEMAKWLDRYNIVTDTLNTLESGAITKDQVDTFRTVYPSLYNNLASQIAVVAAERGEPLSYETQSQLATLGIQVPSPEKVAARQASFVSAGGGRARAPGTTLARQQGTLSQQVGMNAGAY